jgi:hypothetical protein
MVCFEKKVLLTDADKSNESGAVTALPLICDVW